MAAAASWKLPEELVKLSNGESWPEVLGEWKLDYVEILERDEESEICLCHHRPIRELCHVFNKVNKNTAIVGNCCVTKFEKLEKGFWGTHKIFEAFKRIQKNLQASANIELIKYAHDHRVIDDRSYLFYKDIWKKRSLSDAQIRWKIGLNQKIITFISAPRKRDGMVERVRDVAGRAL